ncbi:MAG: hypothetical protein E6G79_17630 [Alphaproteobacteria bacterium]|nr:MAG: hypothetical protein E6G79_17630 [Alphaproteobacteria bacterium]
MVDPHKAKLMIAALRTDASFNSWLGRRSSHTMATARRPASLARRRCNASTAANEDAIGKVKPSASAIAVIVDAVPMVLHVPTVLALPASISDHSRPEIFPVRS